MSNSLFLALSSAARPPPIDWLFSRERRLPQCCLSGLTLQLVTDFALRC